MRRRLSFSSGTQQDKRGGSGSVCESMHNYGPVCRFNNALTPVYFRRADAFIVVYDVSDRTSFKATKKWVSVIKVRQALSVVVTAQV